MFAASAPLNIWIFSRNLGKSREFYGKTLGFPLWREEPGTALHFGVAGSLLSIRATEPPATPARGMFVLLPVGRDIDQICAELSERGVNFDQPLADREFGRSAMIRDPDGYEIWFARPSATETQFHRWRLSDRVKGRRLPVNRRSSPRRHEPRPTSRRHRHPSS